jgi:iron complex outermembrane receptor protein
MSRFKLQSGVSLAALVLAGVFAGAPALAQDERGTDANTIEEVVVTATKRSESVMNVAVSLSAVTAQDIERLGAKDLEDLARNVPSLVVAPGNEQSDKSFIIRGVGSDAQSATVAVYIDDTPITFGTAMPDLKLFDLDRIEVLRGPQGTLFGSSAMGGAVRYISPPPGFAGRSGMIKGEVSTIENGDLGWELQGAVGAPLVEEKVAFRASAFTRHDAGYIDLIDEDTGKVRKKNVNDSDSWGGRIAIGVRLSDSLDATLSAIYQQQNDNSRSTFFSGRGVDLTPPFETTPLPAMSRVDRVPVYRDDKIFLPNLTLNADLGFARLTSSTSYIRRESKTVADFSYFVQTALGIEDPFPLAVSSVEPREFNAWVEEIRLASTGDGPLQWLVGAYYRTTDEPSGQYVPSNLGVLVPDFEPLLLANGSLFDRTSRVQREQKALFGEISYTLADKLKLTAGLRLTEMTLQLDREADGLFNDGFSEVHIKSTEKPVTPKFSAQYTFSPNAMIYATAAKGFREGGPNSPVPSGNTGPGIACTAALAALGKTSAPDTFATDTVWSYELGAKVQTADRRLRFVGAVYNIDWDGIQQSIALGGGCGFSYIDNIGKARSRGFEAELNWRPTTALRFDLNVGYTDAHLTQDLVTGVNGSGDPVVLAQEGTKLPGIPELTLALAAQYGFHPVEGWDAFVRGEVQYSGDAKRNLGEDPRVVNRDAYTVVNLRLGAIRGPYEFNVFVNNVLDNDTLLYQSYDNFAPGALVGAGYEGIRVRPRIIGASLKRSF